MKERAELTGGSFAIESTPGEGTTIRASWPIEAEHYFKTALSPNCLQH
jgi:signal transduction histidine kinase